MERQKSEAVIYRLFSPISAYSRMAEKNFFASREEASTSEVGFSAKSRHKGDGLRLLPSPSVALW
jgi:hypothetical protein